MDFALPFSNFHSFAFRRSPQHPVLEVLSLPVSGHVFHRNKLQKKLQFLHFNIIVFDGTQEDKNIPNIMVARILRI